MCLRRVCRIFLIAFMATGWGVLERPRDALAEAAVYVVSAVPVDVTAATAAQARQTAIAEGHRQAFDTLMNRLVLAEDMARLPELGNDAIADLVGDFSVANERTSAVRYLADLTFRFKPGAVRNLFRDYGVRFTEARADPLVVAPVFQGQEAVLFWEEDNPWYLAWAERLFDEELVPLVVPLGDLGDVASVDTDAVLALDPESLVKLARRYGSEEALVVQASLEGDPEAGTASLDVAAVRVGAAVELVHGARILQEAPGPEADLLAQGVSVLLAGLQESWKVENHVSFDRQRVLTAVVPIAGLADWLEVKRRLEDIAAILQLDLIFLSREVARADITYIGDEDRLIRSLAQSDLSLAPSALAGWELRLGAAALETSTPLLSPMIAPEATTEGTLEGTMESEPEVVPEVAPLVAPEEGSEDAGELPAGSSSSIE
jgi:hypothetical protein